MCVQFQSHRHVAAIFFFPQVIALSITNAQPVRPMLTCCRLSRFKFHMQSVTNTVLYYLFGQIISKTYNYYFNNNLLYESNFDCLNLMLICFVKHFNLAICKKRSINTVY